MRIGEQQPFDVDRGAQMSSDGSFRRLRPFAVHIVLPGPQQ